MSCNVAQCNAVVPGDVTAGLERCALCKLMSSNERTNERTRERTNMELLRALHSTTLADYAMRAQRDGPGQDQGTRVPGYLHSLQVQWYHAADQILGISSRSGVQPTCLPYSRTKSCTTPYSAFNAATT